MGAHHVRRAASSDLGIPFCNEAQTVERRITELFNKLSYPPHIDYAL